MPESSNRGRSNDPETGAAKSGDLVQGTLQMLILKTLALEPMHGYGVALRIEQVSAGVFRINPGSLLPALSRLERAGQVNPSGAQQRTTAGPSTTRSPPEGAKPDCGDEQWDRQAGAIRRILKA